MSAEAELWMLCIAVAAAVIPWAMSIHAKVAVIAKSVEELPQLVRELRETLEEHEMRLDQHDEAIKAIQVSTRFGH
jgi:hypothetical protein